MSNKRVVMLVLTILTLSIALIGCNETGGIDEMDISKESDEIIAVVNGEKITEKDLYIYLETYKVGIIDSMIEDTILKQLAKDKGIEVTDKDVDNEIEEYRELMETEEAFEQLLVDNSTTLDGFKVNIRQMLTRSLLLDKIKSEIEVTEEEALERYEINPRVFDMVDVTGVNVNSKDSQQEAVKLLQEGKSVGEIEAELGGSIIHAGEIEGVNESYGELGLALLEVGENGIYYPEEEYEGEFVVYRVDKVNNTFESVKDLVIENVLSERQYEEYEILISEARGNAEIEKK